MAELTLIDPPADVAVGARRAEVLAQLREADGPLSVQQVASQTGLHVNTARFHLGGLVGDGLAERTAEERDLPGRPRILYTARTEVLGPRSYGLLAEMLTGLVASLDDAGPAAVETGRAWGRHLVDRPAPSTRRAARSGPAGHSGRAPDRGRLEREPSPPAWRRSLTGGTRPGERIEQLQ